MLKFICHLTVVSRLNQTAQPSQLRWDYPHFEWKFEIPTDMLSLLEKSQS